MKKCFTTFLLLILAGFIFANPVDIKYAKKIAERFYSLRKGQQNVTFNSQLLYTHTVEGTNSMYVFQFDEGGFVIVSADDVAKPIIGYSLVNTIKKHIDNESFLGQLNLYGKMIHSAANKKVSSSYIKKQWQNILNGNIPPEGKSTGPLLETTWDQSPYYNQLCPSGAPTGCVATAMSQVMKYYQWPTQGYSWHKYIHTTYGTQYVNFWETTYDWTNMPNSLSYNSSNTEKTAIATLCYHAGVSVDMNYTSSSSGAYTRNVLYALVYYFDYDPTTINYLELTETSDTSAWITLIKNEIDSNRPVIYTGSTNSNEGHAWVCDGYNDMNLLNMNWGWGGSANGYFDVAPINAGGYDFTNGNSIVYGIQPNSNLHKLLWVQQASGFASTSRGIKYISAVNNRVAWATNYDGSSNGSIVKEFTRTTDGGATWIAGNINAANTTGMEASMICAISDSIAWAPMFGASDGGKIVKTSDGGKTWVQQSSAAFTNGFPNVVYFWNENKGFCMGDPNGGYFEIYTTTNGGDTWTRVSSENIPSNLSGECGTTGLFDVYENIVWFSTNKGRIFKSTDYGNTWQIYTTPLTSEFQITFKNENIGIILGKQNSKTVFCKTLDGGQTWTTVSPIGDVNFDEIKYVPGTDTLISGGVNYNKHLGISYSIDDGNTFVDYAPFYQIYQITALGTSPNGTVWAGGFNSSSYSGGMWRKGADVISADFEVNETSAIRGDSSAIFTDLSYGSPNTWEWNFGEGAEPQTSTEQGPITVKYTSYGDKTVTLTIQKGEDLHVLVKENVLNVTWPESAGTQTDNSKLLPYPNPSSQNIYVKLKGFTKGSINVYSITGALVWSSGGMTENNQINISNLSSGVYLIKVEEPNKNIITRKLTITR